MDNDHVEDVRAVVRENRSLTVREVPEKVGLSKCSCHTILTQELGMRCVATKFVPHLLTDEQKANRVTVSEELFDHSNADDNFLKNVLRGDEMRVD
jgi:histone-lysine N-methyltransferase SETMAR